MTTNFKLIPTLAPQQPAESAYQFGLRAFRFLSAESLYPGLLDTPVLEQTLAASQDVIIAADMHSGVRERLQSLRLDITRVLARRQKEVPYAPGAVTPPTSQPAGGLKSRRLVPTNRMPPGGVAAEREVQLLEADMF